MTGHVLLPGARPQESTFQLRSEWNLSERRKCHHSICIGDCGCPVVDALFEAHCCRALHISCPWPFGDQLQMAEAFCPERKLMQDCDEPLHIHLHSLVLVEQAKGQKGADQHAVHLNAHVRKLKGRSFWGVVDLTLSTMPLSVRGMRSLLTCRHQTALLISCCGA